MAADTFTIPAFAEPALYSRHTLAPMVRSVSFELANLTGAAGSAADPLETNDVIKLFKLPPDVKFIRAKVESEALDSGSSLVVDLWLTNGTVTKKFFTGMTVLRAGGQVSSEDAGGTGVLQAWAADAAIGWVNSVDDAYLYLKVTTGSAGAGAGDGIRVTLEYTSALEANEANFRT